MSIERVKIMSTESQNIIQLAKSIKTVSQALKTAMMLGDVTAETMHILIEIDKGNFSRILSGQSNLPIEKIAKFCEIVGNDLLIHWIAYQQGFELRVFPKTLEQKILEKDKKIEKLSQELESLRSLVKESLANNSSVEKVFNFKKS